MAGKMKSQRLTSTKAACGHVVSIMLPPGELGVVGRRRIAQAQAKKCHKCRTA